MPLPIIDPARYEDQLAAKLARYRADFAERRSAAQELARLEAEAMERAREADMLRFGVTSGFDMHGVSERLASYLLSLSMAVLFSLLLPEKPRPAGDTASASPSTAG